MENNRRLAVRATAHLPVNTVVLTYIEHPVVIRFYLRIH
jgi:hypothetical protein